MRRNTSWTARNAHMAQITRTAWPHIESTNTRRNLSPSLERRLNLNVNCATKCLMHHIFWGSMKGLWSVQQKKHYHALTVAKCSKLRKACSTTGSSSTKARNHPAPPVVKYWQRSPCQSTWKFLLAKEHFKGLKTSKPKLKEERGPSTFHLLYWPRGRSLPGRRQLHLSLLQPK